MIGHGVGLWQHRQQGGSGGTPGVVAGNVGLFTLTGQDATLIVGRLPLTAAQGSFALTGQSAGVLANRLVGAGQASFALSGQAATLDYETGPLPAPDAPELTITSDETDNTPDFELTGDLVEGDTVRFQYDTVNTFDDDPQETTNTIDAGEDAANQLDFSTGTLADGEWFFRARIERPGHENSDWSNIETITIATGGGFALVANAAAASDTGPTTSAVNTTGANLLVVSASQYAGVTAGTLTDSKGNTWTALTIRTGLGGNADWNRLFYCAAPVVGSGHTFTYSNGGNIYAAIAVQAWSGANAAPFDVENGTRTAGATSLQPGSITPAVNNSLIISAVSPTDGTTLYGVDAGFTVTDSVGWASGVNEGIAMAYLVQTTAASVNPTWSWTASAEAAASIAAFKPS